jgi:Zn ribbon nucleic-acid-binding protein
MEIGKVKIDINCPACKRKQSIALNDISQGKIVKCLCGQSIQLVDQDNSMRKSIKDLDNAFSNLERSFKKLGK